MTMSGALSPPMASTASVKGPVIGWSDACRSSASGPYRAPQRLAGRDDLAPVVMAAMAAHVMRPLQLAAIGAFGMGLVRQCLMAAAHAPAGRAGFSLWNGHGPVPLL